jgi:hypothetical protein
MYYGIHTHNLTKGVNEGELLQPNMFSHVWKTGLSLPKQIRPVHRKSAF